jgi:hypothetical protein
MRAHLLGSVRDLRSSTSDAMTQQHASGERSQADDSASSWATPCLAATDNAFVQSRRRTHLLDLLNLLNTPRLKQSSRMFKLRRYFWERQSPMSRVS